MSKLIAVVADEDTVAGLCLAGVGDAPRHAPRGAENFFIVRDDTPTRDRAEAFERLARRPDVAVLLVTQSVADSIRDVVDARCAEAVPAVLEIPSAEDGEYDLRKDALLKNAHFLALSDYVPEMRE